jgi:squalene-associated FAD-dependent desaturase
LNPSVLIFGGGLAGLAAAGALAVRGFRVTLLESRQRLGGRASSFTDAATGQLIDTCQHVTMGCCTNFAAFCETFGIDRLIQPQPLLRFMTPDRRVSPFQADPVSAPLHLARSFLSSHYLTAGEKLRIAWGLSWLQRTQDDDVPFLDWLRQHRQTPRTIEAFWGLVLTSALNETPDRIGLRYARKVFLDGFLRHRRGFEVSLPTMPLGQLYGEVQQWLDRHAVQVRLGCSVRQIRVQGNTASGVETRQGETLTADWYISAVPFDRLLELLPGEPIQGEPYFGNLRNLETSPITSVHLWYDRPVSDWPHVVLVDCVGQWLFNRGETPSGHYVQIVVSAARRFRSLGHEELQRQIVAEVASLFPAARPGSLLRARTVTEQSATFSAVPGVDRWRPAQASPIGNLFIAGDWTATGWPATMEGAVRSGWLAVEALLSRMGKPERIVRPDL